jgi:hypothetical protein
MHGVAPHMCGQVVRPSLGGGTGGRSPGLHLSRDGGSSQGPPSGVRAATIRLTRSETRQLRKCACCGAPTPTQSMCACWAHWMALPEDLRSEFLKSYGRDEFANYHRNILKAVEIWRRLGVWRVPIDED